MYSEKSDAIGELCHLGLLFHTLLRDSLFIATMAAPPPVLLENVEPTMFVDGRLYQVAGTNYMAKNLSGPVIALTALDAQWAEIMEKPFINEKEQRAPRKKSRASRRHRREEKKEPSKGKASLKLRLSAAKIAKLRGLVLALEDRLDSLLPRMAEKMSGRDDMSTAQFQDELARTRNVKWTPFGTVGEATDTFTVKIETEDGIAPTITDDEGKVVPIDGLQVGQPICCLVRFQRLHAAFKNNPGHGVAVQLVRGMVKANSIASLPSFVDSAGKPVDMVFTPAPPPHTPPVTPAPTIPPSPPSKQQKRSRSHSTESLGSKSVSRSRSRSRSRSPKRKSKDKSSSSSRRLRDGAQELSDMDI